MSILTSDYGELELISWNGSFHLCALSQSIYNFRHMHSYSYCIRMPETHAIAKIEWKFTFANGIVPVCSPWSTSIFWHWKSTLKFHFFFFFSLQKVDKRKLRTWMRLDNKSQIAAHRRSWFANRHQASITSLDHIKIKKKFFCLVREEAWKYLRCKHDHQLLTSRHRIATAYKQWAREKRKHRESALFERKYDEMWRKYFVVGIHEEK